jgi:hypothetical protein
MTAIIAYSWRSTSLELVNGGSSSSTGLGVSLPFSTPAPDRAWWAHNVLRMKAAVALSDRKSLDLFESRFGGAVDDGREMSLGLASPWGFEFALLGWSSRDGSSVEGIFGGIWFMAFDCPSVYMFCLLLSFDALARVSQLWLASRAKGSFTGHFSDRASILQQLNTFHR